MSGLMLKKQTRLSCSFARKGRVNDTKGLHCVLVVMIMVSLCLPRQEALPRRLTRFTTMELVTQNSVRILWREKSAELYMTSTQT